MKNIEIKKTILEATKKINTFQIRVILWHGDTMDYNNAIYNEVCIFDENGLLDLDIYGIYGEIEKEDTNENIKILVKEQKKIYNYMKKHFENVIMVEENV